MTKKTLKDAFEVIKAPNNTKKEDSKKSVIKSYKAPSRNGKKLVGAYVDNEAAKQLKILAIEENSTIDKLIKESINDLFQKYDKSRIA